MNKLGQKPNNLYFTYKFNEELGVEIAYYRALVNSLGGRKGKF